MLRVRREGAQQAPDETPSLDVRQDIAELRAEVAELRASVDVLELTVMVLTEEVEPEDTPPALLGKLTRKSGA
jgi:cell division protein FtsB